MILFILILVKIKGMWWLPGLKYYGQTGRQHCLQVGTETGTTSMNGHNFADIFKIENCKDCQIRLSTIIYMGEFKAHVHLNKTVPEILQSRALWDSKLVEVDSIRVGNQVPGNRNERVIYF
jgi:hypothetical protein